MAWTTPKTWSTGDVLTAADMNTYVRDNSGVVWTGATGTYTGDGATSQAITVTGVDVKFVMIWPQETTPDAVVPEGPWMTTDTIVDDNASGVAFVIENSTGDHFMMDNKIIAVGSESFTVDDSGSDSHPNKNTFVYNYFVLGPPVQ